jgi:hypothetical protein
VLLGLSGLIGSGKSTVAEILIKDYGFTRLSFADSLKDAVSSVFCWDRELLEGDSDESRHWREQIDTWWADKLNMPDLTPRWVLQFWGTELCRNNFHEAIWIASMERKILNLIELSPKNDLVIPDTRFPNEIEMIKRLGGQAWRVRRGKDPHWFNDYVNFGIRPTGIHPSEWEWTRSEFNVVINNNGSLEELNKTIEVLLRELNQ